MERGKLVVERVGGKSKLTRCFSKYPFKFIVPNKVNLPSPYNFSIIAASFFNWNKSIFDLGFSMMELRWEPMQYGFTPSPMAEASSLYISSLTLFNLIDFFLDQCVYTLACENVGGLHRLWCYGWRWLYCCFDHSIFYKGPPFVLSPSFFSVYSWVIVSDIFISYHFRISCVASLSCFCILGAQSFNLKIRRFTNLLDQNVLNRHLRSWCSLEFRSSLELLLLSFVYILFFSFFEVVKRLSIESLLHWFCLLLESGALILLRALYLKMIWGTTIPELLIVNIT